MPTDNGPKRDVTPEKYSTPKKTRGESFDEAMNDMNTPTMKRRNIDPYNVTDAYTDGDNSCND